MRPARCTTTSRRDSGIDVGFYAGWVYYWGTMVLTAAIPLIIGGITYGLLPRRPRVGEDASLLGDRDLIYCAALFCLLYFGVHISTRAQLILVIVSVTVVLGFFLYIIFKGGAGGNSNSIKPFLPSSSEGGWTGIFYGVLYGILIFTGFETAANLAEETAEPKKSIPRAIFLAIGVVGDLLRHRCVRPGHRVRPQHAGLGREHRYRSRCSCSGSAQAFGSVNFDRAPAGDRDPRHPGGRPRGRRSRRLAGSSRWLETAGSRVSSPRFPRSTERRWRRSSSRSGSAQRRRSWSG